MYFFQIEAKADAAGLTRRQAHQRLQELSTPCWCALNQPLKVQVNGPAAAVQFWSVVRQLTASRQDLVGWLERCWHEQ